MLHKAKHPAPFADGIVPPTSKDDPVFLPVLLGVTREYLVGTVYLSSHWPLRPWQ